MITSDGKRLIFRRNGETLLVEGWGKGLRVRAVPLGEVPEEPWALETVDSSPVSIWISEQGNDADLECGGIRAEIRNGRLFFRQGEKMLLEEYQGPWPLRDKARNYHTNIGSDDFACTVRFNAYEGEMIHGMGQYQQTQFDLKGCSLELAQRNSQISIPFALSNRGYGFLWNNPAIGYANFAANHTEWHAISTKKLDYWICAGDTPAEILEKYTEVVGRAPVLPDDVLGLWQCKLRYRTQEEVLEVAREYKRRGLKLDVIVIDFFHWVFQGDYDFDRDYWPDPEAMVRELNEMGVRVMVSVWPTVDARSNNHAALMENGYLIRTERGMAEVFNFFGHMKIIDPTNPDARKFIWEQLEKHYGSYGIDMYWLDEAEPEVEVCDFDHYRYHLGPAVQVGNIYPLLYTKMVYDGMKAKNQKSIINLVRCGWVGSQKYNTLIWSGDIASTFDQLKLQIKAGLNMGLAGIPWWISDTGGFYWGNSDDPMFQELLIRWFQFAVYCPILRMHGHRQPNVEQLVEGTDHGGGVCPSGKPNELWSYGEQVYEILVKYLKIREELKPYVLAVSEDAAQHGAPMLRAMFYEFPQDEICWRLDDQYLFGPDYLVAPVTDPGARSRKVYLPAGQWESMADGTVVSSSGEFLDCAAPLDTMPVFRRLPNRIKG